MAGRRATASFDFRGLARHAKRLGQLGPKAFAQVEQRTLSTLSRRLPVEASRLASEKILNLPRSLVRKGLSAYVAGPAGERAVVLSGSRERIPLSKFGGAYYGGRRTPGAVAQPYRDDAARTYASSFAIKGRGIRGGIWSRLPKNAVNNKNNIDRNRFIIQRKGPSISRAILERKHGDIFPALSEVGSQVLRAEIARLLKAAR